MVGNDKPFDNSELEKLRRKLREARLLNEQKEETFEVWFTLPNDDLQSSKIFSVIYKNIDSLKMAIEQSRQDSYADSLILLLFEILPHLNPGEEQIKWKAAFYEARDIAITPNRLYISAETIESANPYLIEYVGVKDALKTLYLAVLERTDVVPKMYVLERIAALKGIIQIASLHTRQFVTDLITNPTSHYVDMLEQEIIYLEDDIERAKAFNTLALYYINQHKIHDAQVIVDKSLTLCRPYLESNPRHYLQAVLTQAILYRAQGKDTYQNAHNQLDHFFEIADHSSDPVNKIYSFARFERASLLFLETSYTRALEIYQSLLKPFRKLQLLVYVAMVLHGIGLALSALGRHEEGEIAFEKALAYWDGIKAHYEAANILFAKGYYQIEINEVAAKLTLEMAFVRVLKLPPSLKQEQLQREIEEALGRL